jgi:nucleotide-sensitive chloride channel 1A
VWPSDRENGGYRTTRERGEESQDDRSLFVASSSTMSSTIEKPQSISASPRFITQEEHRVVQQSTPEDFSQVPPVLHRKEKVSVSLSLDLDGFPLSRLVHGDLYVTEECVAKVAHTQLRKSDFADAIKSRALSFVSAEANTGFSIPYPSISLHAISRAPPRQPEDAAAASDASQIPPGPSIYCQLDVGGDDEEEPALHELVIIADDPSSREYCFLDIVLVRGCTDKGPLHPFSVEPIFEALSHCSALFPTIDDDEAPVFEGAAGDEQELSEVGRVRSDFQEPSHRFAPY